MFKVCYKQGKETYKRGCSAQIRPIFHVLVYIQNAVHQNEYIIIIFIVKHDGGSIM